MINNKNYAISVASENEISFYETDYLGNATNKIEHHGMLKKYNTGSEY